MSLIIIKLSVDSNYQTPNCEANYIISTHGWVNNKCLFISKKMSERYEYPHHYTYDQSNMCGGSSFGLYILSETCDTSDDDTLLADYESYQCWSLIDNSHKRFALTSDQISSIVLAVVGTILIIAILCYRKIVKSAEESEEQTNCTIVEINALLPYEAVVSA